ncbi:unnamed protein product, partial [Dovyalis caffra]
MQAPVLDAKGALLSMDGASHNTGLSLRIFKADLHENSLKRGKRVRAKTIVVLSRARKGNRIYNTKNHIDSRHDPIY